MMKTPKVPAKGVPMKAPTRGSAPNQRGVVAPAVMPTKGMAKGGMVKKGAKGKKGR